MEFLTHIKGIGLLVEFLIKSTVILTLSFSLVFLLRKKSATLKHFLLSVSLICLLLLPVFSTFSQGWETRLLPSLTKGQNSSSLTDRSIGYGELSFQYGLMNPINDKSPLLSAVTETKAYPASRTAWLSSWGKFIGTLLIAIWTAGLLFLVARIFLGLYGAYKLTRQGKTVTGLTWRQLLLHFLQAVSIKRKISLLSHRQVKVPLTWGVFKPVVIVPVESKNWTRDECSSALFHELSHIKRGDFMVKILARLSCALYWFNPLSWFALRMIKKEQEKACDELVLKAGVKPSTYAENLLAIKKAGRACWNPPSAALGAVGKSQLNERLLAILKQQLCPKEVKMRTKIILSTLVIVSMVFIGLARPSTSAAQGEKGLINEEKILAQIQPIIPDATVQEKKQDKQKKAEEQKKVEAEKKEQEKTDQKTEEKKKFSWVTKDGKTIDIYITSGEGEEDKVVQVIGDMEIHINKDSDKKIFTIRLPHEHLKLTKNEEGEWTLERIEIEVEPESTTKAIKLKQALALQNRLAYTIKLDKDKKGLKYVTVGKPVITLNKTDKLNLYLARPYVKIDVATPGKVLKLAQPYTLHYSFSDSQEINEKLEEIREKLKQVRENEGIAETEKEKLLEEIEEMLKELSETLKIKKEELKDIKIGIPLKTKKLEELKDIEVGIVSDLKEIEELKDVVVSIHPGKLDVEDLKNVHVGVHAHSIDVEEMKDVVVSVHPGKLDVEDLQNVAVGVHVQSVDVDELKDVVVSVHPDKLEVEDLKNVHVGVHAHSIDVEEMKDVVVSVHPGKLDVEDSQNVAVGVHVQSVDVDELKDVVVGVHPDKVDIEDLKGVVYSIHPKTIKVENLDSVMENVHVDVGTIYIEKLEGDHAVIDVATDKIVVGFIDEGEGEFQILIKADLDKDNRGQYEEAVAKIREKLGETYTVESEIDEETGKITIKISGVTGGKETKISVEKIIEDIKEELSHIKGI
jgi:beta-lactamase regulating signal transducer with metallopeptidase domain